MKCFTSGLDLTEQEGEIPCVITKILFFIHHDGKKWIKRLQNFINEVIW